MRENTRLTILEMHEKLTKNLFPLYLHEDERFLALALCGEAGELANLIKKRWRDDAALEEQIRDEIADVRIYLELLANCFNIPGEALNDRVESKLERVAERFKDRLNRR